MAKRRRNEPQQTPKAPIALMAAAAIALIALVAWALTRSVEPSATTTTTTQVAQQPSAIDTSTFSTPPVIPPAGSTTAWNPSPTGQPTLIPPGTPAAQPPAQPQSATAEVPRMSVEDLKAKLDRGEVTVVDVRDATSFAQGHIPGSIHIPMASIQASLSTLPKNKPIVTYCT